MLSFQKPLRPWTAPFLLVTLAGCGSNEPKIIEVTGILTYKGTPVTNARVTFIPESGRPSHGETDGEGRFKLNYDKGHDGAIVGKHKVSVKLRPTTLAEQDAVMMGKKPPMSKEMAELFDRYGPDKSAGRSTHGQETTKDETRS